MRCWRHARLSEHQLGCLWRYAIFRRPCRLRQLTVIAFRPRWRGGRFVVRPRAAGRTPRARTRSDDTGPECSASSLAVLDRVLASMPGLTCHLRAIP